MEQKKKVNEVDKGAIDAAVQQALDSDMPKPMPHPKARLTKVPRPKPRPTTRIGGMPGGSTRGIDPRDNYSPEDLKRLLMQNAMEAMEEGYYVMPDIDKERYTPMDGLEGPFQTKAGKPIYYDPKEGAYYDRDTDMYLTYSEFKALDEGYSPGDENEEGMVSNCCGAPIMDVYDGHGRCSDCKEMASAVSEAQLREFRKDPIKPNPFNRPPSKDPINGRPFPMPGGGINDPGYGELPGRPIIPGREPNDPGYGELPGRPIPGGPEKPGGGINDPGYGELPGRPMPGRPRYGELPDFDPNDPRLYQKVMKRNNRLMQDDVAVRRDGKTLSKGEKAKLQRQGVLMKEGEDKPYICVHAKKGKHECHAESSYAAAKKAAKHWGLKSTSGIDAHLAESMPMKPLSQPKRVSMTNKQNFRKNFAKRYIDMYPATSEGHSPHKKGTKKYKAHMAAMHANSVDLNAMRDALKLDESANANTVIAEYTRATLDHSYKTWKQVDEQIEFIRSFVKEDVDVNAVAVMLRKMHERENLDQSMQVKENINKLRQIVKENNTMKVTFNDGAMNVDTTTAKVFLEVYNKQKSQKQNQIVEKIQTKSGFLSMLEMMYKKIG